MALITIDVQNDYALSGSPLEIKGTMEVVPAIVSLLKLFRELSKPVFTGCNFPNCPRTSIYQASERDYRLIIIRDALSGIYDKGIEELKNIGCEIVQAQDLARALKPA